MSGIQTRVAYMYYSTTLIKSGFRSKLKVMEVMEFSKFEP